MHREIIFTSLIQMKKKIYIPGLLLLTLFAPIDATSQEDNLIPNPGFEQYKRLPEKGSEGLSCVDVWRNPILIGLGDYYHADSKSRKYKTGRNVFGWQQPHSGKAFAGICVNKKIREYLQVQLLRPLKKDKEKFGSVNSMNLESSLLKKKLQFFQMSTCQTHPLSYSEMRICIKIKKIG